MSQLGFSNEFFKVKKSQNSVFIRIVFFFSSFTILMIVVVERNRNKLRAIILCLIDFLESLQ